MQNDSEFAVESGIGDSLTARSIKRFQLLALVAVNRSGRRRIHPLGNSTGDVPLI